MILKVSRLGHPVVRRPCERLSPEELRSPETRRLLDDMAETMREYNGVGIAANQVHVSKRLALIEVRGENPRYPDEGAIPLTEILNPEIVERSTEMEDGWEGCLSVPGLRGLVPRHRRVRARAWDREGKRIEFEAEGFFARIIQHECDHLDGKVYLDRMPDLRTLSFQEEFDRFRAEPR